MSHLTEFDDPGVSPSSVRRRCSQPFRPLVLCAQPANVDIVLIDEEPRKLNSELIGFDCRQLVNQATAVMDALKGRVGAALA